MERYLGVHSTIVSVGRDGTYRIAADNSRWYWTEEMFEEKTSDIETSYYDISTIERLARSGPIHVQRFEGGWKIIEKEFRMKTSDKVLWFVWLALIELMLFKHEEQRAEIQRLNGVVYELRMERVEWLHNIQVMEAKVASVELREE